MNDLIHFLKYSFVWDKRLFFLVTIYTFASLIYIEYLGYFSSLAMLFHCFVVISYVFSLTFVINSVSTNTMTFGGFFSGKYLQALPISKIKFLVILNLSHSFVLIPIFITLTWICFRGEELALGDIGDLIDKLNFVKDHYLIYIYGICFLYSAFIFSLITSSIEDPRKIYNRGNWSNLLLFFSSALKYFILVLSGVGIIALTEFTNNSVYIICFIFLLWFYHAIQAYRYLVNEKLSYWSSTRDIAEIIIHFLGFVLMVYVFLIIKDKGFFDKSDSWKFFYRKGSQIFFEIGSNEWAKIKKRIESNEKFGVVNEYGVSAIHYLIIEGIKKEKVREYILEDKDVLKIPITISNETALPPLYANGVTGIHLLAYKNDDQILKEVISKDYSLLSLEAHTGQTPLHYSAHKCSYLSAKVLIDSGAQINAKDMAGDTALAISIRNNCPILVSYLVYKGANLAEKNNLGDDALGVAKRAERHHIEFLLKEILGNN